MEKKGLGRGLSALLADVAEDVPAEASGKLGGEGGARRIPIEQIVPNPSQPRRNFSDRDLEDLAASIREKGIIQPLILRPHPDDPERFQIVAGERRWRSAQLAGVHEVPALVRELDDADMLEIAIIENVQRADLNAAEEALGYRQLMDRFGHTQEKLAEVVGKSRSHIANLLRLLTLPEAVLDLLRAGRLSAGHARALITAPDPTGLAAQVVERDLSVRQTEQLARTVGSPRAPVQRAARGTVKDADTRALEEDLTANLRLKVSIEHQAGKQSGEMRIRYTNLEELDGICQLLTQ